MSLFMRHRPFNMRRNNKTLKTISRCYIGNLAEVTPFRWASPPGKPVDRWNISPTIRMKTTKLRRSADTYINTSNLAAVIVVLRERTDRFNTAGGKCRTVRGKSDFRQITIELQKAPERAFCKWQQCIGILLKQKLLATVCMDGLNALKTDRYIACCKRCTGSVSNLGHCSFFVNNKLRGEQVSAACHWLELILSGLGHWNPPGSTSKSSFKQNSD